MSYMKFVLLLAVFFLVDPVGVTAQGKKYGPSPMYSTKKQCKILSLKRKDADRYTARRRRNKKVKMKVVERAEFDTPLIVPKGDSKLAKTNKRRY